MFWGFIKFSGERDLIVVENKLDSGKYQTILRENLMENMFLGEIFQQDNAPCHVSVSTLNFSTKMVSVFLKIGLHSRQI